MTVEDDVADIPSGTRIAKNTFWNIVGMCLPMLVALFCIPPMTRGLEKDQFGLLMLIWLVIGYSTVFDMGIGRALTKAAAERIGARKEEELPGLFWTSCGLMLIIGIIAGAIMGAIAPWLSTRAFNIPAEMQTQTLRCFQVVAFGLPVIIMTAGMIGMLEAKQKFAVINAVRVPMGSFTYIGPLLVFPFSKDLLPIVIVLLAGRIVEWLIYFLLCLKLVPSLRQRFQWENKELRPLICTGIWINISSMVMPLIVHADRFLIGALVSVGAVAYYAICSEIVVKLLIFPRAVVSVLFPAFAAHFGRSKDKTAELFALGFSSLFGLLFPLILIVVAFAPEGFRLWLGNDFAVNSTPVMRWLTAGVFVYCLTYIPYSFLQGIGRADVTARIHVIEFLLFVILAIFMIQRFGITGAAMAWVIRAVAEVFVMLYFASRYAPVIRQYAGRWLASAMVAALALGGVACFDSLLLRSVITCVGLIVWAGVAWILLLRHEDRVELLKLVSRTPAANG